MSANNNNNNGDVEKAVQVVEKAAPLEEQASSPTAVTSPSHTRRLILVVVALFFIAILAIGLGVGLSNKKKKNTVPESSQANSLERLCSAEKDMDACRMACQEYMCCFDENAVDCNIPTSSCGAYAPCFILTTNPQEEEGGASLPGGTTNEGELQAPPAIVEEICNSEYMEVSDMTCEEACWEANCCYWTGEESCYEDSKEVCDLWKAAGCFVFSVQHEQEEGGASIPGGTVLEDGEKLEEPDATVEEICNGGYKESDITCEEACNKADCCYWTGEDSCYADNEDTCKMWKDAGCFAFSVQHEEEVP